MWCILIPSRSWIGDVPRTLDVQVWNQRRVQAWLDPAVDYVHLSALLGFILRLFPSGSKMAIDHLRPTLLS